MVVLGKLRAVGAFVTHVVGLHCALSSIAALRKLGRVLRRAIPSEMKAVRRADSIHKAVCSSAYRRTQKHCAPQSEKNNSDRVPKNEIRTNAVLKVLMQYFVRGSTSVDTVGLPIASSTRQCVPLRSCHRSSTSCFLRNQAPTSKVSDLQLADRHTAP